MAAERLHIGAGRTIIPGFVNMDVDDSLPGIDVVGDVRDLSAVATGRFAEVYLSHILEHIAVAEVPSVLKELHRIIAPGGTIRISVPDLDRICCLYVENIEWFTPPHSPWLGLLYGGQVNSWDFHRGGFNFRYLRALLEIAGFADIVEVEPSEEYGVVDGSFAAQPFGRISVTVVARKGATRPSNPAFRHSWAERALAAAERPFAVSIRILMRVRLALVRRRLRRLG